MPVRFFERAYGDRHWVVYFGVIRPRLLSSGLKSLGVIGSATDFESVGTGSNPVGAIVMDKEKFETMEEMCEFLRELNQQAEDLIEKLDRIDGWCHPVSFRSCMKSLGQIVTNVQEMLRVRE